MRVANDLARSNYADIETVLRAPKVTAAAPADQVVCWVQGESRDTPHDGANLRTVMRPVYVGQCFGWLHTIDEVTGGDVAVLICPGLTRDRLDAHHSLRMLAEALARNGYPAMRFDYPGVGDSCDFGTDVGANRESTAEPWQCWLDSVRAAIDWLRDRTGASRVILCGLRLGATLATLAVERRDDVAGLALLAPVLRGRSYMQQLQMEARLQRGDAPLSEPGLELHEVQFDAETINLVSRVDLRRATLPPGLQVALFLQAASKLGSECEQIWTGQGANVVTVGFEGLEPLLRHNEETEGTPPDFTAILGWIRRTTPAQPKPLVARAWPETSLEQGGWVETPQRFGDGLFGMFCCPKQPHRDIAVIIGNTGRDPHYGAARLSVAFARHLAAEGIASLRIDFAGLGDSRGPPGKEDVLTSMFESDRSADISAAIEVVTRMGYRSVAVQANCSGSYHMLHAALADPRITTLLLVNLPAFEWHVGDSPDFAYRRTMKAGRYLSRLSDKQAWSRLLRGKLDVGNIIRAQCMRSWRRIHHIGLLAAERRGLIPPQSVGRRAVAALSKRGVRTLFLFSRDDIGIDAMEQEFGHGARWLGAFPDTMLHVVPEADHLLSTSAMRRAAFQIMVQFLADKKFAVAEQS